MRQSVIFSVFGRRHTDVLMKDPVKLGKTVEAAGLGDFRNGRIGVDQQRLHITDPGHLDVIGDGKSGDLLKFVGQIAGAEAVVLCQTFQ